MPRSCHNWCRHGRAGAGGGTAEHNAVVDAPTATRTELRTDEAELRNEVAEVRRDTCMTLAERARVGGAWTGPWRPTNGSPAAAPKGGTQRLPPSDLPLPVRLLLSPWGSPTTDSGLKPRRQLRMVTP